jgi:sugar porter (SP) family MFS transporter
MSQIKPQSKWPQYIAALSAAGGAFAVGSALGWPSPIGPRLVTEGDDRYFPISQSEFDWSGSIITIGCAISCLPIGILMKKFGRKWTMMSLIVPFIIGWALVTFAKNFAMLLAGRLILGIAGGAFCVSAPQYSSEIAEKEIRGIVGTFFQLLINGGILFVYIIGAFIGVFWTNIICAIIPLVFGFIFFFMPESPVYLLSEKRDNEALSTFKWLRGQNYNPQHEIDELKLEIEENERMKISFGEVLRRKATKKALLIGFGLMIFQQACGINVVIFNATTIFDAANTGINSDYQTIIIGAVLLVATLLGSFLVDRTGRKILLVISSCFMTLMLFALGIYFYLLDHKSDVIESLSWLPLTSLCVHLIAYSVGYGPLPWLLMSEVYSKECNAIASPITG